MTEGLKKTCFDVVLDLDRSRTVGQRVRWETIIGREREGELIEWDNWTAIIKLDDGSTTAVQC